MLSRFNVRVYGLLENERSEVLLVHERIGDFEFVKFPGGGLELGEGTREGLVREFREETGLDVETGAHFYTTDFFQQSMFHKTDQLIAVYYHIIPKSYPVMVNLEEFTVMESGRPEFLRFFWVPKGQLHPDSLTFPIDKKVCELYINQSG